MIPRLSMAKNTFLRGLSSLRPGAGSITSRNQATFSKHQPVYQRKVDESGATVVELSKKTLAQLNVTVGRKNDDANQQGFFEKQVKNYVDKPGPGGHARAAYKIARGGGR